MKVLVTGGAGFLGSVLVGKLLDGGFPTRIFDSIEEEKLPTFFRCGDLLEFTKEDIKDRHAVSKALDGVNGVVHLAALVGEPLCSMYPELARQINLEATCSLVDLCKVYKIQSFVFASTCSVYGISGGIADENSPLITTSHYTETKVKAEKYVLSAVDRDFHPCVLRFATLYGMSPTPKFDIFLNELVWNAAFKKEIVVYGEDLYRPLIHVSDAADAIIRCLNAPLELISGKVFNVGSDSQNYQKIQMAKLVLKYFPDAVLRIVSNGKTTPRNYKVSFKRVSTALGFKTTKTIEDGIIEIKDAIERGVISNVI